MAERDRRSSTTSAACCTPRPPACRGTRSRVGDGRDVRAAGAAEPHAAGARGLRRARARRRAAGALRDRGRAAARAHARARRARARGARASEDGVAARARGVDGPGHPRRDAARRGRAARGRGRRRARRAQPTTRSRSCARPATTPSAARAMGFCLFNNTAIAARWAQRERGLEPRGDRRLGRAPRQRDGGDLPRRTRACSRSRCTRTGSTPRTPGRLERARRARARTSTCRCRPSTATTGTRTRSTRSSRRSCARFAPDLIIVGAGQDASATDPLGRMSVNMTGYRALTERAVALAGEVCGGRLVVMLEGGYSLMHLPLCQPRDPRGTRRPRRRPSPPTRSAPTSRPALRDVEREAVAAAVAAHDVEGLTLHAARRARLLDRGRGQPGGAAAARGRARRRRRRRRRRLHRACGPRGTCSRPTRTRTSSCSRAAAAVTGRAGATAASSRRMDLGARRRCGPSYGAAGDAWVDAARETVDAIGAWCEAEGVDAHYRRGGELVVSTAPAQDGDRAPRRSTASRVIAQTAEQARARCDSPVFRGGVYRPERGERASGAARVRAAGAAARPRRADLRGQSQARAIRPAPGGVEVRTDRGPRARARRPCWPINAASGRAAAAAQPADGLLQPHRRDRARAGRARRARLARRRVDLRRPRAAALPAHDARRPDPVRLGRRADGRRRAAGRADGDRPRRDRPGRARPACACSRSSRAGAIAHAWGGPIDVSPTHRPGDRRRPRACRVGRVRLHGQRRRARRTCSAARWRRSPLDRRDDVTRLPFVEPPRRTVPPEPLRIAGAAVIRRALVRKEAAEEAGTVRRSGHARRRRAPGAARAPHRPLSGTPVGRSGERRPGPDGCPPRFG